MMGDLNGVYNGWQGHLLVVLGDDEPEIRSARDRITKAMELALEDPAVANTSLPRQLARILQLVDDQVLLGLRLSVASFIVPIWAQCSECSTRRLCHRSPSGPFKCGDPAALHPNRRCG